MKADAAHQSNWAISEVVFGVPLLLSLALKLVIPFSIPAGILRWACVPLGIILIIAGMGLIVLARREFARFQQSEMADHVAALTAACRRGTAGGKLVVFFYGYVFEFGAIVNDPSTSGHYALRRVLNCPDIDVLCSPISYFDRGLGQSGPAMTAAESVALAGKMWLSEDDTRTYLGTGRAPGWPRIIIIRRGSPSSGSEDSTPITGRFGFDNS